MSPMQVQDVMTTPVVSVAPGAPLVSVVGLRTSCGFSTVPVLDENRHLLGVVHPDELLSRGRTSTAGQPASAGRTAAEVMTAPGAVVSPHADVIELVTLMFTRRAHTVLIVEDGHVVGIVTRSDVLRAHRRNSRAVVAELRTRLDAYVPPRGCRITAADGVVTIIGRFNETDSAVISELAETVPGVTEVHLLPWPRRPATT